MNNVLDDRANDEADRHAQMMQEQREGWDGKKPKSVISDYAVAVWWPQKGDSNEK